MTTQVSLAQLMLRVRQRANLEGSSAFLPDSEVIDNINQSIAEWYDIVRLTTFGGQIARSAWPIVTLSNVSSYPLAQNTASIISVDANISGNSYAISALPYQEEQRNIFKLLPYVGWSLGGLQNVFYQIQGQNINFLPTPTANYNITVNYIPTAPVLSNANTDYLNSINGWEEWIVLDSAIKCLIKDGQLDIIPLLQGRLEQQTARIKWAAALADMNAQEGVHETETYGGWGPYFR